MSFLDFDICALWENEVPLQIQIVFHRDQGPRKLFEKRIIHGKRSLLSFICHCVSNQVTQAYLCLWHQQQKSKVMGSLGKGSIGILFFEFEAGQKFQWKSRKAFEDLGLALRRGQCRHADQRFCFGEVNVEVLIKISVEPSNSPQDSPFFPFYLHF